MDGLGSTALSLFGIYDSMSTQNHKIVSEKKKEMARDVFCTKLSSSIFSI